MEQSVPHERLEAEIHELAREAPRESGGAGISREAIHRTIEQKLYAPTEEPTTLGQSGAEKQNPPVLPGDTSTLPSYATTLPADAKLEAEQLLDLAWHKGIAHALRKVRQSDPLTMDLFHDAIVEKLYVEFKKQGLLK